MIKKIDANEYGVVKYAITSVDELNRLPKKIAPSSQAILIENGLRVFVYGDGQWVEEVVDGDLSENMRSIVTDYERSKIGYDGVKRGSLEERLKDDFQGIYDILNARDYCEYSSKELKADNTWMGNQIDTKVEGRTLQNLLDYDKMDTSQANVKVEDGRIYDKFTAWDYRVIVSDHLFKPNSVYTLIIDLDMGSYTGALEIRTNVNVKLMPYKNLTMETSGVYKCKCYTTDTTLEYVSIVHLKGDDPATTTGTFNFGLMILEGDYTQTPLSELPYFEGIESVGEREIGKNLLDVSQFTFRRFDSANEGDKIAFMNVSNRLMNNVPIKVDINKKYSFSVDSNYQALINGVDNDTITQRVEWRNSFANVSFTSEDVYVTFRRVDENSLTEEDVLKIKNTAQLEEGVIGTEYEPFGYKIKGKSCGKNLINPKKVKVNTGTSMNVIDDNTFEISIDDSWGGIIFDNIELKEGKKYTLTYDCENDLVLPYIKRKENGAYGNTTHYGRENPVVVTPTDDITVRISITSKEAIGSTIIKNIILAESDDISYQPYQESTYSVHSPIPLRSLPNGVCDVYDFESGAVIQRVGKIVLDGTQRSITRSPNSDGKINTSHFSFDDYKLVEGSSILCDKLIQKQGSALGSIDNIECVKESGVLWINVYKTNADTVGELITYLSTNPMTVYHELEEPIIHYLTPSQLKSFEGTTHVISENTLIPTTTTKILTDTYANVSNVNSTAYSLRRGVNDVAETSAIINETDVEQDDVLDITMCAIDELYSMLEPNLE